MIVVLKHNPNPDQVEGLVSWLQEKGVGIHLSLIHISEPTRPY